MVKVAGDAFRVTTFLTQVQPGAYIVLVQRLNSHPNSGDGLAE